MLSTESRKFCILLGTESLNVGAWHFILKLLTESCNICNPLGNRKILSSRSIIRSLKSRLEFSNSRCTISTTPKSRKFCLESRKVISRYISTIRMLLTESRNLCPICGKYGCMRLCGLVTGSFQPLSRSYKLFNLGARPSSISVSSLQPSYCSL